MATFDCSHRTEFRMKKLIILQHLSCLIFVCRMSDDRSIQSMLDGQKREYYKVLVKRSLDVKPNLYEKS